MKQQKIYVREYYLYLEFYSTYLLIQKQYL